MLMFFLLSYMSIVGGYMTRCPHVSQWRKREEAYCNATNPAYICLYDENERLYVEMCTKKHTVRRAGNHIILTGNLHSKICDEDRYQPVKFSTADGNSDCMLQKSACNEEGQVTYDNGDAMNDVSCTCDHYQGYAFVTTPVNRCYCMPQQEDCSCYRKSCDEGFLLSPDFDCIELHKYGEHAFNCSTRSKYKSKKADHQFKEDFPSICQEKEDKSYTFKDVLKLLVIITLCIICGLFGFSISISRFGRKRIPRGDEFKRRLQMHQYDICTTIKEDVTDFLKDNGVLSENDVLDIGGYGIRLKDRNHRLLQILWKKGKSAFEIFLRALDHNDNYSDLSEKIKKLDDSLVDEIIEENIADDKNDNVPGYNRELNRTYIKRWLFEDKEFKETKIAEEAKKTLTKSGCILLVGETGVGKTLTLRHFALELWKHEGYDIIPIVLVPVIIRNFYNPERKQVFVVDDFCGVNELNETMLDLWVLPTYTDLIENLSQEDRCDRKDVKILIACNTNVYTDERFKSLDYYRKFAYEFPKDEVVKNVVMEKSFRTSKCKDLSFSLLVKLSKVQTCFQLSTFFDNPLQCIRKHFFDMSQRFDIKFRIMSIVLLFGGCCKQQYLLEGNTLSARFGDSIKYFKLDTKKDEQKIKNALSSLEESYLSKSGDSYEFVHREILEIAYKEFGTTLFKPFLEHVPCKFIGDMYKLDCLTDFDDNNLITVLEDDESLYFERIMRDLEKGKTYSFLHNCQLKSEQYRSKLITYCKKNENEISTLISKINKNKNAESHKDYQGSTLWNGEMDDNSVFMSIKANKEYFSRNINSPLIEAIMEGYEDIVECLTSLGCSVRQSSIFGRNALYISALLGEKNIVKFLYNNGADVLAKDHKGRSPLYVACKHGNYDVVDFLTSIQKVKCEPDDDGKTPLHVSAEENYDSIVHILIDKLKPNVNSKDKNDKTALYLAAEKGNIEVVDILLKNSADATICDSNGWAPLFAAIKANRLSVVTLLLKVEFKATCGMTPLSFASRHGCSDALFEVLIHHCKNLTQCDDQGRTALSYACQNGRERFIEILLSNNECKAIEYLDKCDNTKKSSLHYACENGNVECIKLLMNNGANIEIRDENHKTPLHYSCERSNFGGAKLILEKENLKKPNLINDQDKDGNTILHLACQESSKNITELLLNNNADQTIENKRGMIPLHNACKIGSYELSNLLLDHTNNTDRESKDQKDILNYRDKNGETPLFKACTMGFSEIARLLVSKQADANVRNASQRVALHEACFNGYKDIAKVLALYSKETLNFKDNNGKSPIELAQENSHMDLIEYIGNS